MRVLLIDGTTRPDGYPTVEPYRAWVPAWSGGTRAAPGQAIAYQADQRSGMERKLQLPDAQYGGLYLPPSDRGLFRHPLREIGTPGLLFERAATQLLETTDWDISTWTGTNSSAVTSGIRGPTGATTGEGQAYRFTSTASGGQRALSETVAVNMNATTYVFSVWLKRQVGHVSEPAQIILRGGASSVSANFEVGDGWTHCYVTSPNINSTTAQLIIVPAINGDAAGTIEVWGPTLVDTGTAAANASRGRSTTISPSGVTVASKLTGAFAWPAPPWTLFTKVRPMWSSGDSLGHGVFEALDPDTNVIYRLTKVAGNTLQANVRDWRGNPQTAVFTSPAMVSDTQYRILLTLSQQGALSGYLNGVEFDTQIAAPAALPSTSPTSLVLGDSAGLGALDAAIEHFELWDELLPAEMFL